MPLEEFNMIDEEYFKTILEDDFVFEGAIKIPDSLIIKGKIKGKLESNNLVVIGPNSIIDADITSKQLQCYGKINGNITIEDEVYFHSPSVINGDITTNLITVEKGCKINGKVRMLTK